MIVTCASCLTKFNLNDARIQATGVKVRCSRCKHVFYVVPPPETKEEVTEGFESFAKYHEELMEPGEKKETPPEPKIKKEERTPEGEEEAFLFSEKAPIQKPGKSVPFETGKEAPPKRPEALASAEEEEEKISFEEPVGRERTEGAPSRRRSAMTVEKKGPSRFLTFVVVFILLVFAIFYIWSELSSGGRLSPYLVYPVKKVTEVWNLIWGVEKEDLTIGDLNRYDEKVGEVPLSVIEGKVKNQSRFTKKYIKVRVMVFDRDRFKVAEKEAICGEIISREELKKQPAEFFQGEMVIRPQTVQEMVIPPGQSTPFMVILKDPPSQAQEFEVEIIEAPNL